MFMLLQVAVSLNIVFFRHIIQGDVGQIKQVKLTFLLVTEERIYKIK